jgi:hypothetical protein
MGQAQLPVRRDSSLLSMHIPAGHVGPLTLPGSDREVWWTGRVAIGLRFERQHTQGALGQSAAWVQSLLLGPSRQ